MMIDSTPPTVADIVATKKEKRKVQRLLGCCFLIRKFLPPLFMCVSHADEDVFRR